MLGKGFSCLTVRSKDFFSFSRGVGKSRGPIRKGRRMIRVIILGFSCSGLQWELRELACSNRSNSHYQHCKNSQGILFPIFHPESLQWPEMSPKSCLYSGGSLMITHPQLGSCLSALTRDPVLAHETAILQMQCFHKTFHTRHVLPSEYWCRCSLLRQIHTDGPSRPPAPLHLQGSY